jgi:hypothetical protein
MDASTCSEEDKSVINSVSWDDLICKNKYINKHKKSKSDIHSFCSLVNRPLTQSQNVTLGICMEQIFKDYIANNTVLKDISQNGSHKKGERQKDHMWLNESKKEIIYAEQKNNINLDTEKSLSTQEKVLEISKKYPEHKISAYILATRYLHSSEADASRIIKAKYKNTKVIGVNEYLELFGLTPIADYDSYKKVIMKIVQAKFGND